MTHWELLVSLVAVRRTDGRTDGWGPVVNAAIH